ncbi:MAG: sulfotransferase [Rhodobacteraceae bacterium]|nr:sulfotransferase [Paracoccaceae bacterium]
MYTKPDFIGIGQMKAGTGWLYDNLRSHRHVWMPIKKELQFFNAGIQVSVIQRKLGLFIGTPPSGRFQQPEQTIWKHVLSSGQNAGDMQKQIDLLQLDFDFFINALFRYNIANLRRTSEKSSKSGEFLFNSREAKWYNRLFPDTDAVPCSGEISPSYAVLSEKVVKKIINFFPQLRVILILRDPMKRSISHIQHLVRTKPWVEDWTADRLFDLIQILPNVLHQSRVSGFEETWLKHIPDDRLLLLDFRDIIQSPESVMADVATFLCLEPGGYTADLTVNQKEDFTSIDIPDTLIDWLEQELAGEAAHMERILGRGSV